MSAEPPIPRELWDKIAARRPGGRPGAGAVLERRIAALEARLGQDSSNSSRPPSTDPLHVKRRPPRPPRARSGAGSPATSGTPARWSRPSGCRRSSSASRRPAAAAATPCSGDDPEPIRHQVAELPAGPARRRRVPAPSPDLPAVRGRDPWRACPPGVPRGAFGPRLQATLAPAGRGLPPEQAAGPGSSLADLLGLSISAGHDLPRLERHAADGAGGPGRGGLRARPLGRRRPTSTRPAWREGRRQGLALGGGDRRGDRLHASPARAGPTPCRRCSATRSRPGGHQRPVPELRLDQAEPPGLLGAHHPNAIDKSVGGLAPPRVRVPPHRPAPGSPPGRGLTAPRPPGPAG